MKSTLNNMTHHCGIINKWMKSQEVFFEDKKQVEELCDIFPAAI